METAIFRCCDKKIKSSFSFKKDKQFLVIWKEETTEEENSCFTKCAIFKRLWSDPQILRFNSRFSVLFEVAIKKIPQKIKQVNQPK